MPSFEEIVFLCSLSSVAMVEHTVFAQYLTCVVVSVSSYVSSSKLSVAVSSRMQTHFWMLNMLRILCGCACLFFYFYFYVKPCASILSTVMWIPCISLPRSLRLLLSGPAFCVPCEGESLRESGTYFLLCGRCLRDGIATLLLCWRFWLTSVWTMSRYLSTLALEGEIPENEAESMADPHVSVEFISE